MTNQAYFDVGPVTRVTYAAAGGKQRTLSAAKLSALRDDHTYADSALTPVGEQDAQAIARAELRDPAANNPPGRNARRPR